MRVALVIHGFPPANMAGSEVYTYNLAVELNKHHEVFVFHRVADPERPEYDLEKSEYMGLHITTINNNFKNCSEFKDTYYNETIAEKFGEFLDEVSPHVVHFHHLTCLSTTCVEEVKKRNIPVVYTLHDFWLICQRGQLITRELAICDGPSDEACAECLASQLAMGERAGKAASKLKKNIPSFKGSLAVKELMRKAFLFSRKTLQKEGKSGAEKIRERTEHIREVCSQVDTFIAPSKFLRGKYLDFGIPGEKIIYSDYGFDKSLFEGIKRKKSKKIRFGYIGSWIPSKGVHVLIKAFNRVAADCGAELIIYGEQTAFHGYRDYDKNLTELVKNESISLPGSYENKDVGRILSGIDVLVVPSIWYENSPLTIHEAYLAGVPVIASDIGGMAEYVREGSGGLNFKAGDDEDLYRVIQEIIDNPGLLDEMRKNLPPVKSIAEDAGVILEIYTELTSPAMTEGYDFIRNVFHAKVDREGKGFTETPYSSYKQRDMVNVSTFKVNGQERRVLFAHPIICVGDTSTIVSFRGLRPAKGETLDFGIGINEEAWGKPGDGVEFEVLVRHEKNLTSIYKKYIDPKANETDRKWFDESLRLEAFAGKTLEVLFRTSAGPRNDPEYDWAGWSAPSIVKGKEIRYDFLNELNKAFIIRPEKEDPKREDIFYLGDDARQVLSLDKGSEFVFSGVPVPEGGRLKMGVGVRGGPKGLRLKGGLEIDVVCGNKTETIFSRNALASFSKRLTKNAWHDVELDLKGYGAKTLDFHFRNKSGKVMGLGPLEIVSKKKKKLNRQSISHTNVLIISLDAVRADHMGFMGNKAIKTPCLDRMAGEGAVFKKHFAQSHITIPSHISMLTSKFPRTIKTMDNYQYNLPVLETIAGRLAREGYQSSAVVSTTLLNPQWCKGLERGFTDYFPVMGMERGGSQSINILKDWISENSEKPFFSFLHLFDAHFPYQAPKPFHGMYPPAGDSSAVKSVELHAQTKGWLTRKGISTVDIPISEYKAEITYLDYELNRLFTHMEALGVLDNTLIMITADHGEYLGER
ncbi:MAG: sulfatase-like hydrolase/transferase, partial [Thermodesulfobacteriota bacterium]